MKKFITVITVLVLSWVLLSNKAGTVSADWWTRPTALPTQPSFNRPLEMPTTVVNPTVAPTTAPSQPTVAPTSSPTGGTPSTGGGSTGGGSSSTNDPCAAGQSFVGPYCGWTPNVDNSGGNGGGGGGSTAQPRVGGPQILGLSDTSSGDLALSDIMILAGVLCLALYARSKITIDQSR